MTDTVAILVDAVAVPEDPVRAEQSRLEGKFRHLVLFNPLVLCSQELQYSRQNNSNCDRKGLTRL